CARCELDVRPVRRSCSASCTPGAACPVRAAVLLPRDADQYEVALPRVLPVMALAAEAVSRRGLWPLDLLSFLPGDDKCDAVYGQISAVDSYAHDCAHVFFGPACEYSVGEYCPLAGTLVSVAGSETPFSPRGRPEPCTYTRPLDLRPGPHWTCKRCWSAGRPLDALLFIQPI
ncbi:uncharacterized protein LOC127751775, partial [Frankliniella occidentalis]|uniref:Uncharacterized protein LOC127751775 n=1 Tax=Frankliniella occidentalis TaxID=133901 RepID=A0A9C6XUF5_FRAOC